MQKTFGKKQFVIDMKNKIHTVAYIYIYTHILLYCVQDVSTKKHVRTLGTETSRKVRVFEKGPECELS